MPHTLYNKINTTNLHYCGMAAGLKLNGSALNMKEPDSAIMLPEQKTTTVAWKNRILLLNASIVIAENQKIGT
jgi:hypothetical protein